MTIKPTYKDLRLELAKAACAMVHAHMDNETMVPALDDVAEQFPDLTRDQLTCLWMGVNAKDREGLVRAGSIKRAPGDPNRHMLIYADGRVEVMV